MSDRAARSNSSVLPYVPALDGLRAIAALAVIVEHVYQEVPLIRATIPGYFGVRLFFVLSGYLITGILLSGADASCNWHGKAMFWKNFYVRRALRIFPAYYLCLIAAVVLATKVNGLQGHHGWRFAYLTNFHMALHDTGDVYYGHLWTLAVEEQFYLFWPFVILLLPVRWRVAAALGLILAGPVSRLISAGIAPNEFWIRKPTWCCFDSLGFGALLACWRGLKKRECSSRLLPRLAILASVVLLAGGLYSRWRFGERAPEAAIFLGLAEGFLFFLLLRASTNESNALWKQFLAHRWLVAIGKVSYGLYLYHAFVMPAVSFIFRRINWDQKHGLGLHFYFVLVTTLSIGVAFLSWKFFEGPLNRLKSRFPYYTFTENNVAHSRQTHPAVYSA